MGIPGRLNSEDAANNVQSCCTCKIRAHNLPQTHSQSLDSENQRILLTGAQDTESISFRGWVEVVGTVNWLAGYHPSSMTCFHRTDIQFKSIQPIPCLLQASRQISCWCFWHHQTLDGLALTFQALWHASEQQNKFALERLEALHPTSWNLWTSYTSIFYAYYILSSSMLGCSPGGSHFLSAVNKNNAKI